MIKTPKSLRLQIGIFGRTNVGKSSFLNMVSGQQVAITSETPGTTTDVVEKSMELLPIGPVVFLDTAGLDDKSELAEKRIEKTRLVFLRADIAVLVAEPEIWGDYEAEVLENCRTHSIPLICIINKTDLTEASDLFVAKIQHQDGVSLAICWSAVDYQRRDYYINLFKRGTISLVPDDFLTPPPLAGDLVPAGGHVILIVPIDIEAPKGRIILPQVQTLRDLLDADTAVTVVKEHQYAAVLSNLVNPPDLVVCDSQVVDLMVSDTPPDIPCTTFSTLFSRYKGDLRQQVEGVLVLEKLTSEDRILIAESCSHHAMEDDIGRVKIPAWLESYFGFSPRIDTCSGRDYPENLKDYSLVIHCGACMLTRREMLMRIELASEAGVPVTNYGLAISHIHNTLERIISPFEEIAPLVRDIKRRAAV